MSYNFLVSAVFAMFFFCFSLEASKSETIGLLRYDFVSPSFSPLTIRRKRATTDDDDDVDDFRLPNDVEVQNDTVDHQYYILETYTNRPDMMKDYYINVTEMLQKPGTVGNRSHPLLSSSYRRAVAAKIQFDFPFYGHRMRNLTIATGGFSYIGDQSHSWLAATQYIAPLMANFDTHGENSTIMYADDGEKFVIEWSNLQLREQRSDGYFTFQVSLHKNGDIWFVYKDIPIPVANVSDSHHPVKLGMSDAYLFQHSVHNPTSHIASTKRVIYEYHRIEVNPAKVTSNTIILIKAQPTCIQYKTCDECSNATLKHFNCSWCHSKPKHGGPFCSDQAGLHRRRQHWIEGNCKDNGKVTYCNPEEDMNEVEDTDDYGDGSSGSLFKDDRQRPASTASEPDQVVPWDRNKGDEVDINSDAHGDIGGKNASYVSLFVVIVAVILVVSWTVYAYYNPHTPSGQFLIRYRPSQWRMPSSHVRYSASVHM